MREATCRACGGPFHRGKASSCSAIFCCEPRSRLIRGLEEILSAPVDRHPKVPQLRRRIAGLSIGNPRRGVSPSCGNLWAQKIILPSYSAVAASTPA